MSCILHRAGPIATSVTFTLEAGQGYILWTRASGATEVLLRHNGADVRCFPKHAVTVRVHGAGGWWRACVRAWLLPLPTGRRVPGCCPQPLAHHATSGKMLD